MSDARSLRRLVARTWLGVHRAAGRQAPAGFRVLLFHDISAPQLESFDRLVHTLSREGRLLTPEQVAAGTIPAPQKPACLLTFDDGYVSQLVDARAVLDRYGARGVFFVCPSLLDRDAGGRRAAISERLFGGRIPVRDLPPGLDLAGWDAIAAASASGHTIGSHTMTHPRLSTLPPDAQQRELEESRHTIAQRLGAPPSWFAFPFGATASIDRASVAAMAAGYPVSCSGVRGWNRAGARMLFRDQIDLSWSGAYVDGVLRGGLDLFYRREAARLRALLRNTCPTFAC